MKLNVMMDLSARFVFSTRDSTTVRTICGFFFENKSAAPVSITQMFVHFSDGTRVRAELNPYYVGYFYLSLDKSRVEQYKRIVESVKFPIVLPRGTAAFEYVQFFIPAQTAADVKSIEVCTDLGTVSLTDGRTCEAYQCFFEQGKSTPPQKYTFVLNARVGDP